MRRLRLSRPICVQNMQMFIFLSAGLKEVFIKLKMFTKEMKLETEKNKTKKKQKKKTEER